MRVSVGTQNRCANHQTVPTYKYILPRQDTCAVKSVHLAKYAAVPVRHMYIREGSEGRLRRSLRGLWWTWKWLKRRLQWRRSLPQAQWTCRRLMKNSERVQNEAGAHEEHLSLRSEKLGRRYYRLARYFDKLYASTLILIYVQSTTVVLYFIFFLSYCSYVSLLHNKRFDHNT